MKNVKLALNYLHDMEYSKVTLYQTKDKQSYYSSVHDGSWRLMHFIPDSITYTTTNNPKIAFEAGSTIGKFHRLLADASPVDFIDTIPQFHSMALRKTEFENALKSSSGQLKSTQIATVLESVFALMPQFLETELEGLPLRICHNDTKLNNILYSKKENKGLCLIDLDTIMRGYFYYDFGDAIRTIVNTAVEDEKDLSKIVFSETLFEAFINGLATVPPFLTYSEIQLLAMGPVYMPFIHGLRALTDYLNDNIYYKVTYEEQNLDRSKSLLRFALLAKERESYMRSYISANLRSIDEAFSP